MQNDSCLAQLPQALHIRQAIDIGPEISPQLKLSQLLLHGVPISQRAKSDSFLG